MATPRSLPPTSRCPTIEFEGSQGELSSLDGRKPEYETCLSNDQAPDDLRAYVGATGCFIGRDGVAGFEILEVAADHMSFDVSVWDSKDQ